ncbi:DNA repair protein RecN (Recombination protein N) [Nocardioides zeae]|uniref:DNA repair protein RecN n=2 Tax=Nocardioides zeae TaxID=1457234 RepID=A0AAJ1TXN9_9ACTN|nr:DNA repair protein RecN [Nocardioides zeae]MDQ1104236.1 DNA repair protein RecN (Recombination protein N) [Nocardioides zeae]MDR6176074.1 DNA repair protein RecN (Recombination protein N) [Nocardioides zeae]MDR6210221.1 DNA repair protein RecN (Recombination protein N) [Nocardioides zeae]
MLEEIRISSLGVIDSSTLQLGPGLTVVTGETGAGKTMVVTALGLLLGGRADSGAVRTGARAARVEGVVDVSGLGGFAEAVEDAGGVAEDDRVVLARNIAAEGRSRAFAGGASVPVAVLGELAGPLVAVHGQSDQHRLLRPVAQREALDRFGAADVGGLVAAYRTVFDELVAVERELADVVTHAAERAQEADLLRFGLEQVAAVEPQPGEDDELAAEESRLGYADELRTAAERAREALSSEQGTPDALGAVAAARHALDGVVEHDPAIAALAQRLAEVGYLMTDVAADVASYASGVDTDPQRLAAVSERRAALTALTRKYGATIDEVLAWSERSARRLAEIDLADDSVGELEARRAELRSRLAAAGQALSAARATAAADLGARVEEELAHLAMPHARFRIAVRQVEVAPGDGEGEREPLEVDGRRLRFSAHGLDEVEMLLAANTGSEPRPLSKGASGGELSRVMLALEVSLAATSPVPTFVFDEVDAGVGGKAGIEIGRRLAALAVHKQVLVVTHLPQVAAYADTHVVVRKESDGSVTSSGLDVLDDAAREHELSRMLAGLESSDTAVAHARELLATAAASRSQRPRTRAG